ncbi:uncharacterized protein YbbC (DUF1343 family) [Lacibacter cauensis]|uniref:Uncharacterized protein YbbC (DUF1343 family) n=1 Tax=Lacibacter cauensis TaxID=510947 RepID=A0A562SGU1_9BACT|nr:DUF1343 domain-containing protein [Lacibacter cauensis]TWI80462.1 uncharacterized protein YbbC (DUF1343 family) [Lacibacter cauensis]
MRLVLFLSFVLLTLSANTQIKHKRAGYNRGTVNGERVKTGAENMAQYIPLMQGKTVAVFANQTSVIGKTHLVDTLRKMGVNIKVIFAPEHGFRGTADAGEKVGNYTDSKTGIPVISLYGSKRKPSKEDLAGIDVMLFDIQDVGVRFYTFISSLEYYLEAAMEFGKYLIILDRPNPNGHYVDGPVLETPYKSFVGMQPVPIVYGMTIGEYAQMIYEEEWIDARYYEIAGKHGKFEMTVVPCNNYTHATKYELPVKPSPNLPNIQSIWLYPSTCFFEGTVLSEGRGTNKQFQIFGHPSLPKTLTAFTPVSMEGAKTPKLQDKLCYGWDVSGTKEEVLKKVNNRIQLKWLLDAYKLFPEKDAFFLPATSGKPTDFFFNKLAGNSTLMQQLKDGKTEDEIRRSWEPALKKFKTLRKKYLLYKDFE